MNGDISMENRFFQRVVFRQNIEATANDGLFTGVLENISLGGVFIRTNKELATGDQINIKIPVKTELAKSNIIAELTAIRKEPHGIAFTFKDLDPKNFWTLQSFIRASI
jgi:hypothetical protein